MLPRVLIGVLLVLGSRALNLCEDGNITAEYEAELTAEKLFTWCISDQRCCADYHQDYRQNFTIFRHLLEPKISSVGGMTLFSDLLCTGKDLEEINQYLWLSYLSKERVAGVPLCDVNHHLVFNEGDLKYECLCKSDRACSDNLFETVLYTVAVILILVLSFMFLGGNIYKQVMYLKALRRVTTEKQIKNVLKKAVS